MARARCGVSACASGALAVGGVGGLVGVLSGVLVGLVAGVSAPFVLVTCGSLCPVCHFCHDLSYRRRGYPQKKRVSEAVTA